MMVLDDPRLWSNLSETAMLLHVHKGTLSRQATLGRFSARTLGLGRGQARVVPPGEVLRLALVYRRVPPADVVAALAQLLAPRAGQPVGVLRSALAALLTRLDPDTDVTAAPGVRPAWWGALRESLDTDEGDDAPLVLVERAAPSGPLALGPLADDQPLVALDETGA